MRYMTEQPPLDSGADYRIEDGVLEDYPVLSERQRNEATRLPHDSAVTRRAEEMEWAARSGPVTTRRITK